MSTDLATLSIKVDSTSVPAAIGSLNGLTAAAVRTETSTDRVSAGFMKMAAGIAGIAAVGMAVKAAADEARQFETAMAQVNTLLGAGQSAQLASIANNVRELSKEFGQLPTEQAKALYEVISAGYDNAADAAELLATANKLAIGGVTSVGVAADGLTTVMATYGTQLRDVTQASDLMFQAAADGKTNIEELSSYIGKVAPIAAQTGVSFQELMAAAGALTKSGQTTSVAMNGVRGILAQVAKPSKEAAELAESLGIQFDTAAIKSMGFAGFLQMLNEKTHGSTEKLAVLMGGVEALLPAMTLTGTAAADFAKSLENMQNSSGRTEEAFGKMADTTEFKLNQLKAKFNDLQITVGQGFLDALTPGIGVLARNFDTLAASAGLLAKALALVVAARASGWAAEWVKGMGAKVSTMVQARQTAANAALAEAGYTKSLNENTVASLRNALAQLESRNAALQMAMAVEGPATVSHTRAALAANENAMAQTKAALAMHGTAGASRVLSGAMAMLGGPVGIAMLAITALVAVISHYISKAEEARQRSMEMANTAAVMAGKSSQIVADLLAQSAATQEQTKATESLAIAKQKVAALGGKYGELQMSQITNAKQLAEATNKLAAADLEASRAREKQLEAEKKAAAQAAFTSAKHQLPLSATNAQVLASEDYAEAYHKGVKPLDEALASARQNAVDLAEALKRVNEAQANDPESAARRQAEADALRAQAEAAQAKVEIERERAKDAAKYIKGLQDEVEVLGKTRFEAMKLSDEYEALNESERRLADTSIAKMAAYEKKTKAEEDAKRAAEDHKRAVDDLNRSLGNREADQYTAAMKLLGDQLKANAISQEQFNVAAAKAKALWTPEGKAETRHTEELDALSKQVNRDDAAAEKLAQLNELLRDGRIELDEYQREVRSLQEQLDTGFDAVGQSFQIVTDSMTQGIADFVTTGKIQFADLCASILAEIARMLASKAVTTFIQLGMSAFGGGSIPTGSGIDFNTAVATGAIAGRASGGPVHKGRAYRVGEDGEETFVPNTNGTIVPNGGDAQPQNIEVNVTVHADGTGDVNTNDANKMGKQLGQSIKQVLVNELRPGGVLYKKG